MFTLESYTIQVRTEDPGLVLSTGNVLSQPYSFSLEPGASTEAIGFFSIWTDESHIGADDIFPYTITVDLIFSQPTESYSGSVDGENFGVTLVWGFFNTDKSSGTARQSSIIRQAETGNSWSV